MIDPTLNHGDYNNGSVVKQRNFARRRIFLSTGVCTRMREAKSRHDMDTAGVKVEIISLCIFTEL